MNKPRFALAIAFVVCALFPPGHGRAATSLPLTPTNELWIRGKLWMKLSNGSCDLNVGYFNKTNPGAERLVLRIQAASTWRFRLAVGNTSGTRISVPADWDQKQSEFVLHWMPTNGTAGVLTGMVACATCATPAFELPAVAFSGAMNLDSLGVWADSASSTDTNQQQYVYLDDVAYSIPDGAGGVKWVTNFFAAGPDRWTAAHFNRTNGFDFGWTNTAFASGGAGELGGRFVRFNYPDNFAMPRVLDDQSFVSFAPLKLEIARAGEELLITWPAEYANYQLQQRPDLVSPPPWVSVTNRMTVTNDLCVVVLQPSVQSEFYRLMRVPSVAFGSSAQSVWENLTPASISVILSETSAIPVTVDFAVVGGTATGGGVDYTLPCEPLTFAPGVTNQTLQIAIVNDGLTESDETILLSLSSPSNAVLSGVTSHTLAILDNESPTGGPTFQKYETFDSSSSASSHGWVEYKSRIGGNKFGFSNSSNAGGTAGEGGGMIARATEGGYYGDTNLYGLLSTDRAISARGRLKFANTSTATSGFRLGHFGAWAFDGSGKNLFGLLFQESRTTPSSKVRASVRVRLNDGTERNTPNTEVTYTSGNITYFDYAYDPAGSNGVGTITANVRNSSSNAVYTATLVLQSGDKAKLSLEAFGIATGNNQPESASMDSYIDNVEYTAVSATAPVIRFASPASSGLETASPALLDVVLLAAQTNVVTVNHAVTGGDATGGGVDYTLPNGVLSFSPGETWKSISIPITNDGVDETDETIVVSLSSPTNGVLGSPTTHTYTIVDPRPVVSFAATNSSGMEDVSPAQIPVGLSWDSAVTVTVDYAVIGGTATGGGLDYTLANGTLTFAAGQTAKTINIPITYDGITEQDETIVLRLSNPTHGKLGGLTNHTFTIVDTAPAVSFPTASRNGQKTVTPVAIPVTLAGAATNVVTVDYTVLTNSTAVGGGVDYSLTNGTLTFAVGESNQCINLTIVSNANRSPKTIVLGLSNPGQAKLGSITNHTFTIIGNIPFADSNTVALWLFDETEYYYTTLTDAGEYQYDLNLMENGHLVAGKYGNALSVASGTNYNVMYSGFSGAAAHDWGSRTSDPLLWGPTVAPEQILNTFTQSWTCEFWLKLDTAPGSEAAILNLGHAYTNGVAFNLTAGAASFNISNSYAGFKAVCATSPSQLTNGQWHHVAFTRSAAGGEVKHYLDGQLQSTGTVSSIPSVALPAVVWPSSLSSDTLGMQQSWPNEQRRTNRFNVALGQDRQNNMDLTGMIDEMRISKVIRYTTSFTPGTFSRNYVSGAPGPALPDGLPPLFAGNPAVLQLGGRKHVFLDTQLFASSTNLTRVMNPPTDRTQLNISPYTQASVFERTNRIYMIMTAGYSSSDGRVELWYSDDGLNFATQNWGIYGDSRVLYRQPMYGIAYQDLNSNVASNEVFKLTAFVSNRGIYQYFSEDGIHWRRNEVNMLPLISGGMAESYWDDQRGYYSGFIKRDNSYNSPACADSGKSGIGFQSAEGSKTWPFTSLAHPHFEDWPMPCVSCEGTVVFPVTVGAVNRVRAQKYPWAPDTYVAFVWRNEARRVDLAVSRDGDTWTTFATNSTSGPWYVAPFGSYVEVTSLYGMIRRGDEIWQYVNYGTQVDGTGTYYCRLKQRLDGFTSVDAGAATGVAITKPLVFSGNRLVLNLNASGGAARVGILDAAGNAIPGYAVSDCDPITANATAHTVTWQGNPDVNALAGNVVKLRFELAHAKLHAMQFAGE